MVIKQDPRDLILGVTTEADLPIDVHVLAEQSVQSVDAELYLRIIGESHWISVKRSNRVMLHEVLACVPLPPHTCTLHHAFHKVQRYAHDHQQYAVSVSFRPFTPEVAALGATGDYLQVDFPDPLGQEQQPFTRIWWRVEGDALCWWTIHVYSLDAGPMAVFSQSRYRVDPYAL